MNRFLPLAAAPLLLGSLILPSARAGQWLAVLELEEGTVIRYRQTITESQTMNQMGRTMRLGRRVESDLTLKSLGRSEQGNLSIELTFERMKGEIRRPRQEIVVFDTTSQEDHKSTSLMTNILTALVGKTILLTVTPKGKVVSAQGYVEALTEAADSAPKNPRINLELVRAGLTEEAAVSQMQELFPRLPSDPPAKGESWTGSSRAYAEIELLSTIGSVDDKAYTVTTTGSFQRDLTTGPQEPGLVKSTVDGSAQVSRADGLFVHSSLTEKSVKNTETPLGVIPVVGTRTQILKRLPPLPRSAKDD